MIKKVRRKTLTYVISPLLFSSIIISLLFISVTINEQVLYTQYINEFRGDYIFIEENGAISKDLSYENNEEFKERFLLETIHYLRIIDANISVSGSNSTAHKVCIASPEFYQFFFGINLSAEQFMLSSTDPFLIDSILALHFMIEGAINHTTSLELVNWPHNRKEISTSVSLDVYFFSMFGVEMYFTHILLSTPIIFLTDTTFNEITYNLEEVEKNLIRTIYFTIFDFNKDGLMKYKSEQLIQILEERTIKLRTHLLQQSPYMSEYTNKYNFDRRDWEDMFFVPALYRILQTSSIYSLSGNTRQPLFIYVLLIICLGIIMLLLKNFSQKFNGMQREYYMYILLRGGKKKELVNNFIRSYLFKILPISFLVGISAQVLLITMIVPDAMQWSSFSFYLILLMTLAFFLVSLLHLYNLVHTFPLHPTDSKELSTFFERVKHDFVKYFIPCAGILSISLFTDKLFRDNLAYRIRVLPYDISTWGYPLLTVTIFVVIAFFLYLFMRNYLPFLGVGIGKVVTYPIRLKNYLRFPLSDSLKKNTAQGWTIVFFSILVTVPLLSIDSINKFQTTTPSINQLYDVTVVTDYNDLNYVNYFSSNLIQERIDIFHSILQFYTLELEKDGVVIRNHAINYFYINSTNLQRLASIEQLNSYYKGASHLSFPLEELLQSNISCIIDKTFADLTQMKSGQNYSLELGRYQNPYYRNISVVDIFYFMPFFSWLNGFTDNIRNILLSTGDGFRPEKGWHSVYSHIRLADGVTVEEFHEHVTLLQKKYQIGIEIIDFGSTMLYDRIYLYDAQVMSMIYFFVLIFGGLFVSMYVVLFCKQNLDEIYAHLSLLYAKGLTIKVGIILSSCAVLLMILSLQFFGILVAFGITKLFLLVSQPTNYIIPIVFTFTPYFSTFMSISFSLLFLLGSGSAIHHYFQIRKHPTILSLSELSKRRLMEELS